MWNNRSIIPPPVCNLKINIQAKNKAHLQNMKTTMENVVKILSDTSPWQSELHILSRMIYKKQSQRRKDPVLIGLKRIEACWKRFCTINLIKCLEDIKCSMNSCDLTSGSAYLPSRQMLEYVLVRLMGIAALLAQTTGYCVHTVFKVQQDIQSGLLLPQSMIFLSLISRIWVLSKSTCMHVITWYDSLQVGLAHLEPTQVVWLESSFSLPIGLSKWLEKFDRKPLLSESEMTKILKLSGSHGNAVPVPVFGQLEVAAYGAASGVQEEDVGQVISRQEVNSRTRAVEDAAADTYENDEEDAGFSISRDKFLSLKVTNMQGDLSHLAATEKSSGKLPGSSGEPQQHKISRDHARKMLKVANSLNDLFTLCNSIDCENLHESSRRRCITRLQNLTANSIKRPKSPGKLLRKGKLVLRKLLVDTDHTQKEMKTEELSETSERKCPSSKHEDLKLEEMRTEKDIKKLLRQFKQEHSLAIGDKCVNIRDQPTVKRIRVLLKKCLNRIKSDPNTSETSLSKTVRVICKLVKREQTKGDNSDVVRRVELEEQAEQITVIPTKEEKTKKRKQAVLDDTMEVCRKEKRKKKKRSLHVNRNMLNEVTEISVGDSSVQKKRKKNNEQRFPTNRIEDNISQKKKTKPVPSISCVTEVECKERNLKNKKKRKAPFLADDEYHHLQKRSMFSDKDNNRTQLKSAEKPTKNRRQRKRKKKKPKASE